MADRLNILDGIGAYVAQGKLLRPTAVVAETIPRIGAQSTNETPLSTGRMTLQLIYLDAGILVSNITFSSWTTALAAGTNQWFALYSLALGKLAVTADDTSTAWGAFSTKTLAVASPYTVPTSGYYYVGIMVAAGTVPSLAGVTCATGVNTLVPMLQGHDATNTGLTTPATAPVTAAALTSSSAPGTLMAYIT